jgi:outer membrane protein insertion porin family
MPPRALVSRLLLPLVVAAAASARAQEARAQEARPQEPRPPGSPSAAPPSTRPPPDEPPPGEAQEEVPIPGIDDESAVGLGILGGAATLGGAAACRGAQFDPGKPDPPLLGFDVAGELVEPTADLRAVLASALPVDKRGRFWSEEACLRLRKVALDLRYRLTLEEKVDPAGVTLGIGLMPFTLVRHIEVSGNYSLGELLGGGLEPIFEAEIRRRLHLRPGSALLDDPDERTAQLADEATSVREYLAARGYFDAAVKITVRADERPHEVTLVVALRKGPAYSVGKITVKGNANVDTDEITRLLEQKICVRRPLDLPFDLCLGKHRFAFDRLKSDLQKVRELYQAHGYPGVRVTTNYNPATSPDRASRTVRFEVVIDERKRIAVAFEGNHQKSDEELTRLLTFNADNAYDDFEAEASAEQIRHAYQSDGRFQTLVQFERFRPEQPSAFERVRFHIDEGPEQKVEGISFRGNASIGGDELRRVIATREHPSRVLELVTSGGFVTSLQLAQDVQAIAAAYQARGFPDVRVDATVANDPRALGDIGVVAAEAAAGDPGRGLFIRYDIVEGEREVVAATDYVGNYRDITDDELLGVTKLHAGVPFTVADMRADEEAILRYYRKRGYLHASVDPRRTGRGKDIKVVFYIREGDLVHFGKVLVRGNFKTRSWVIRDTLELREGDLITLDRLDEGQASLRGTDLFSSVRPVVLVGSEPLNMIVEVEERYDNTADVEVGGGYSTDNSLFFSGTLGLRNMFGVGLSLVGTGEIGTQRRVAQATLGFPLWLMRRALAIPMRLDLSARYRLDQTARFSNLETKGVSATFSRKLAAGVYFSLKYDWSQFGRSTELVRPAGVLEDLKSDFVTTTTASLGPAIVIDRRLPTPLTPTQGYALSASFVGASTLLGGTDDFLKLRLTAQYLIPLGKRVVLGNTVRYDHGIPLGGTVLLPEVERFTAGGDATLVRGFEEERLHTEIIRDVILPGGVESVRVIPAGGNIRFIHNLDLQFRVWDRSWFFGLPVASAVFLDTAFVVNSFDKFSWSSIRQGLGIALARLVTPVGSFSLEYAFPIDPRLGDDPTGRLHFNFAFVF